MGILSKTKQNIFLSTLVIIVISFAIGYLFLNNQFETAMQKEVDLASSASEKLFKLKIEEFKKQLKFRLDRLIEIDPLKEAIANKDYKKIDAIVHPKFKLLKSIEKDVKILTFRSADGITLYRAHKPKYHGDTLNKKRTLIIDTNEQQKSFSGFEQGKIEMTYRVTLPIFYDSEYVGNVEIGISPNRFLDELKAIFKLDIGVAISKEFLDVRLSKDSIKIDDQYMLISGNEHLRSHFDLNQHSHYDDHGYHKIRTNIVLYNHKSEKVGFLVLSFDMSQEQELNKELMYKLFIVGAFIAILIVLFLQKSFIAILNHFKEQVYTDNLTSLENRQALDSALSSKKSNVLILSNIKDFSLLNELYGIGIGNIVLKRIAKEFKYFAKEHDMSLYRISSDEYVFLKFEDTFEDEKYLNILDKLYNHVNSLSIYIDEIDETLNVEIYSGIAFGDTHSLENAQMALKEARSKSLPHIAYTSNIDTKKDTSKTIKTKKAIKYALDNKNVIPFFQPITNRDGKIVKYEALARIIKFEDGKETIIFPDDFLPVAMKSGLYIYLAKEMLSQSLSFFSNRDEQVSVNFLPNDFFQPIIMDKLLEIIENFENPKRIVVEITEQEGIEDFDRLEKAVKRLKKLGVSIAIDDFGSGYANYTHILKLKPNYLKIDGSLVKNILEDDDSKILVKSIIHFAQDLNIKIIAEYVENEEIFRLLKDYGVDEFQGYYFGKPENFFK